MDITSLHNIQSAAIQNAGNNSIFKQSASGQQNEDLFGAILNSAINTINTTNRYMQDAEREKIRFALGETENSHDLTIALQKSSTALQYTVAVRDKFLEAYKEIMQMQI